MLVKIFSIIYLLYLAQKWFHFFENFQVILRVLLLFDGHFKCLAPLFLDLWLNIKYDIFIKNLVCSTFYHYYVDFLSIYKNYWIDKRTLLKKFLMLQLLGITFRPLLLPKDVIIELLQMIPFNVQQIATLNFRCFYSKIRKKFCFK